MATITVFQHLTLDGVMQGPGGPDEDSRGGFVHGGWAARHAGEQPDGFLGDFWTGGFAWLFGHRTYCDLLRHWTTTPEPNPFADGLVNTPKYVVSRSADTELGYPNSTLLAGEAAETVAALKEQATGALVVMGSGDLIDALRPAGLIDDYLLLINPVVLGSGRRMFGAGETSDLTLRKVLTSPAGVISAHYTTR
ncbi:dihydrofolate reductase family protein [Microlunatus parietis]|uniref:Dihydrofolate reductase n=1 Tax=Microlunatus parietis TaxID=682979 RepID=A0A7Y9L970_9ACTN|nr:dihydrofolate reductase family protein [Microlunatus parietis]NYE71489.1 dihydrofolate reductase [Microlunatus parietis]